VFSEQALISSGPALNNQHCCFIAVAEKHARYRFSFISVASSIVRPGISAGDGLGQVQPHTVFLDPFLKSLQEPFAVWSSSNSFHRSTPGRSDGRQLFHTPT
jgi:hypothetical protein